MSAATSSYSVVLPEFPPTSCITSPTAINPKMASISRSLASSSTSHLTRTTKRTLTTAPPVSTPTTSLFHPPTPPPSFTLLPRSQPSPLPEPPTSAPLSSPHGPHLRSGSLPASSLRTLISLHHLTSTFLTPSTLSTAIPAAFRQVSSKKMTSFDLRKLAAARLEHQPLTPSQGPVLARKGVSEHSFGTQRGTRSAFDVYAPTPAPPGSAAVRSVTPVTKEWSAGAKFEVQGMSVREVRVKEALYGVVWAGEHGVDVGLEAVEEYEGGGR